MRKRIFLKHWTDWANWSFPISRHSLYTASKRELEIKGQRWGIEMKNSKFSI